MIGAHGVDFLDLVAECHRLVHQQVHEFLWGGLAREKLELSVDDMAPSDCHAECDLMVVSRGAISSALGCDAQ